MLSNKDFCTKFPLLAAVLAACIAGLPTPALSDEGSSAQTGLVTTLTFEELPFQSVDGLTVSGVTFDFKIDGADSNEAFYNSFGPGSLTYVDDPSLTGDAGGVLRLEFAEPAAILEFGVALNTGQSLQPGIFIELLREDSETIEVVQLATNAAAVLGFSEAEFRYTGTPVATAIIHFANGPDSFALDNLTFGIPEPATFLLSMFVLGLLPVIVPRERPSGAELENWM